MLLQSKKRKAHRSSSKFAREKRSSSGKKRNRHGHLLMVRGGGKVAPPLLDSLPNKRGKSCVRGGEGTGAAYAAESRLIAAKLHKRNSLEGGDT